MFSGYFKAVEFAPVLRHGEVLQIVDHVKSADFSAADRHHVIDLASNGARLVKAGNRFEISPSRCACLEVGSARAAARLFLGMIFIVVSVVIAALAEICGAALRIGSALHAFICLWSAANHQRIAIAQKIVLVYLAIAMCVHRLAATIYRASAIRFQHSLFRVAAMLSMPFHATRNTAEALTGGGRICAADDARGLVYASDGSLVMQSAEAVPVVFSRAFRRRAKPDGFVFPAAVAAAIHRLTVSMKDSHQGIVLTYC
jgi:hypothetical protein